MKLNEYFENVHGTGVLATAGADGSIDVALYSRPHFLEDDDQKLAFIMADRLSHESLQFNPHAAYLFLEDGPGYAGKRLYLTKVAEETDPEKIEAVRSRNLPAEFMADDGQRRFLVHFQVDRTRSLVAPGEDVASLTAEA